ncbi:ATP-dependent helicase HrpB [Sulfurimonas sp. HSL-3221]|uniref:ATP-dependent helicase HrpB n=1 Tax=Sulfurimonadaceae TaxID=2771471 RepID=UPI001E2F0CD3|nr:ATP-dependent helicase HrpB [Sulfurimonas sp. HSL-3221]UFS63673.1 ATP-dependent helicase HrpB [Sulfurimonas sp. HSL-3221]
MVPELPIHAVLPEIGQALFDNNQLILQAPPGAGKTTVVPLELLEAAWLEGKKVVMLEPRRLAARNAALRMAELLGEAVGERVGYRIRQETKVSAATRIEVVTEGILTRMLQSDPALEEVGVLLFDEFHERSIHADLGLALSLQSQSLLRDDLKLVVMSATLNAEALKGVLPDAAVVTSEGRCYPVAYRYLDIRRKLPEAKSVASLTAETIMSALNEEQGSILVFLPGVKEINAVERALQGGTASNIVIAPLYGDLSKAAQQHAIAPAPEGKRKVVLATNIAETSLTIDGVRIVVDSGLERFVEYDAASGMNRMRTRMITQDSAVQRAGRAGRTQEGVCYRLWHENKPLVPHARPEIVQSDLAPLMLELANWGAGVDELNWVDRPPMHAVEEASLLLISLNMADVSGRITPHGEAALALGLHPRLAHMLLRAKAEGLGYEAVLLATLLQERTGFSGTDLSEGMGWLDRVLQTGESGNLLRHAVNLLKKRTGCERGSGVKTDTAGVLAALAYPDRIAKRRSQGSERFLLANGKGAVLGDATLFLHDDYLAVADAGGQGEPLRIFHAAALSQSELEAWFGDAIATEEQVAWNDESGRVEALRLRRLGALTLEQSRIDSPSQELVAKGVLEGLQQSGLSVLPWARKSMSLRERVNFVNRHMPETFAAMDDDTLLETLEHWLLPYLEGVRDLKGLQKLDMHSILSALLGWDALQKLDALAPETVTVPSGSTIRIDYADPVQPVLAVRLQEVFGWERTPTVLEGSVPLMLHLLSPAQRPVQVTKDLASFWREGYAEVRKELRGRYKKHYWPEDPYEAVATSKTKKGMARG